MVLTNTIFFLTIAITGTLFRLAVKIMISEDVPPIIRYVRRQELVDQCAKQLVGNIEKGGHYFTIWGARQTGKTWLYRQSQEKIKNQYADQFIVGEISMQGIVFNC